MYYWSQLANHSNVWHDYTIEVCGLSVVSGVFNLLQNDKVCFNKFIQINLLFNFKCFPSG